MRDIRTIHDGESSILWVTRKKAQHTREGEKEGEEEACKLFSCPHS
jgi:hypothetical protein